MLPPPQTTRDVSSRPDQALAVDQQIEPVELGRHHVVPAEVHRPLDLTRTAEAIKEHAAATVSESMQSSVVADWRCSA